MLGVRQLRKDLLIKPLEQPRHKSILKRLEEHQRGICVPEFPLNIYSIQLARLTTPRLELAEKPLLVLRRLLQQFLMLLRASPAGSRRLASLHSGRV